MLDLTNEEIHYILNVLAQRPYMECYKLIDKISRQALEENTNELKENKDK